MRDGPPSALRAALSSEPAPTLLVTGAGLTSFWRIRISNTLVFLAVVITPHRLFGAPSTHMHISSHCHWATGPLVCIFSSASNYLSLTCTASASASSGFRFIPSPAASSNVSAQTNHCSHSQLYISRPNWFLASLITSLITTQYWLPPRPPHLEYPIPCSVVPQPDCLPPLI